MILSYNGYTHQSGSVTVNIQLQQILTRMRRRFYKQHRWVVDGSIRGTSQSDLSTKILALEAAYVDGGDLIYYLNDGTTPSAHTLTSASTINGVRVVGGVTWKMGTPETGHGKTEYVYLRSFHVELEAEILNLQSEGNEIIEFHEAVQYRGGYPDYVDMESFTGLPKQYNVKQFTKVVAIQAGIIVGSHAYPDAPPPVFSQFRGPLSGTVAESARINGANIRLGFPKRYRYWFESIVPSFPPPNQITY